MPPDVWSLLVQIPIVVAFIYYTQYMNKQFMEFLREQREAERNAIDQRRDADREIQRDMIAAIKDVEKSIQSHDTWAREQLPQKDK